MEFFEQGVCTSLESFPSVRQMKEEQSMVVRKREEMCMQNCQQDSDQILPGVCKALREAKIRSQNFLWCLPHAYVRLSPI